MPRSILLLPIALLLPACLTVRGAAGPIMTPKGETGLDAAVAMGAGGGGDSQAWFVSSKIGFSLAPVQTAPGLVVQAGVDYVSEKGAVEGNGLAWRAGARFGARPVFGDEADGEAVGYSTLGASVAIFPKTWVGTRSSRSSDDKVGDLFGLDKLRGFYNLGLELGAERMFSDEAPGAWLLSLSLVFDMTTIPD